VQGVGPCITSEHAASWQRALCKCSTGTDAMLQTILAEQLFSWRLICTQLISRILSKFDTVGYFLFVKALPVTMIACTEAMDPDVTPKGSKMKEFCKGRADLGLPHLANRSTCRVLPCTSIHVPRVQSFAVADIALVPCMPDRSDVIMIASSWSGSWHGSRSVLAQEPMRCCRYTISAHHMQLQIAN
jgi:hypothetical protein